MNEISLKVQIFRILTLAVLVGYAYIEIPFSYNSDEAEDIVSNIKACEAEEISANTEAYKIYQHLQLQYFKEKLKMVYMSGAPPSYFLFFTILFVIVGVKCINMPSIEIENIRKEVAGGQHSSTSYYCSLLLLEGGVQLLYNSLTAGIIYYMHRDKQIGIFCLSIPIGAVLTTAYTLILGFISRKRKFTIFFIILFAIFNLVSAVLFVYHYRGTIGKLASQSEGDVFILNAIENINEYLLLAGWILYNFHFLSLVAWLNFKYEIIFHDVIMKNYEKAWECLIPKYLTRVPPTAFLLGLLVVTLVGGILLCGHALRPYFRMKLSQG